MTKIFVFIDESGTLPDPKDQYVVLAAVATAKPDVFKQINTQIRKSIKNQKISGLSEIKFYSAGDRSRKRYMYLLKKEDIDVFVLAVNKGSQKISDSPENYAVLSWLLLLDCQAYFRDNKLEIIFDRHFWKAADENTLFTTLGKLLRKKITTKSADSLKEPGITAADMVAGSFLYLINGKVAKYYDLIQEKIVSRKEINWKEAKRNFLHVLKKLARTDVNTHPKRELEK